MQYLCLFFIFRFIYDKFQLLMFGILFFLLQPSLYGQPIKSTYKGYSTTTTDSVSVAKARKGGMFLEIKSYFEEYSTTKPGSITQFYWAEQQKNGDLDVRYVFSNKLIDFHVETTFIYKVDEVQVLELNLGRRKPLLVRFKLRMNEEQLHVDLL